MGVTSYLHVLDGRLRIKVPEIKKSPVKAHEVECKLIQLQGVEQVVANTTTGNVLVLFNSTHVSHQIIVDVLKDAGCLQLPVSGRTTDASLCWSAKVSEVLVQSAVEFAVERMIVALL